MFSVLGAEARRLTLPGPVVVAAHCKTHQKLEIFGNFVAGRSAGPFVGRHFLLERHFAGEMISVGKARRCPFKPILSSFELNWILKRNKKNLTHRLVDKFKSKKTEKRVREPVEKNLLHELMQQRCFRHNQWIGSSYNLPVSRNFAQPAPRWPFHFIITSTRTVCVAY